jgi:hypothetical protein
MKGYRSRETSEQTAARFLEMRCAIPVTIATRRKLQGWASTLYPARDIDGEHGAADVLVRRALDAEGAP